MDEEEKRWIVRRLEDRSFEVWKLTNNHLVIAN